MFIATKNNPTDVPSTLSTPKLIIRVLMVGTETGRFIPVPSIPGAAAGLVLPSDPEPGTLPGNNPLSALLRMLFSSMTTQMGEGGGRGGAGFPSGGNPFSIS
uniref:Uncharacterized protein n=1 Tax=Nelumbo nucifera TaxID=4432 RepID=A0A822YP81_NELNU|nr:TPA_asm: hypothetical protein HUJ06_009929 [Nelumbo nucifera]